MRRLWQVLLGVALGLVSGTCCFVAGIYFQHQHAVGLLEELTKQDPYAYYIRPKIFEAFCFFPTHCKTSKHHVQRIMKYGFPGLDDVRIYSDFVLSYDRRNRVAHWVCEHLQLENIQSQQGVRRGHASYRADLRVPSTFRSTLADYRCSGFDRGHLAAAGNHRGNQLHCNETFLLTNITPQIGHGFNSGAWKNLEIYVRDLTQRYGSVHVCTGPLFKPRQQKDNGNWSLEYEMIGRNMVAVPTHFFKVIIVESRLPHGKPYMEAYVLPNASIPKHLTLRHFLCDIREIEHHAGLKFYDGLRRGELFGSNYPSESRVFRDFT
ncbi:hypothetical protein KR222_005366 [Zaprionus bogoriensis]|nr:hypothetical protein KR222_005366 [Zaprionus bogoriensis]